MSSQLSIKAKALIILTKTFKIVSNQITPTNNNIDLFNFVWNMVPNPFLTGKNCTEFKLPAIYNNNFHPKDTINGEIITNKNSNSDQNLKLNEYDFVIFYIHGGGFITFDYKKARLLTLALLNKTNCPVLSFDYRFGQKYPFPYALMDVYQTYKWFLSTYNLDSKRVMIIGDSAGGNLVVSLISLLILENMGHEIDTILDAESIDELFIDKLSIDNQLSKKFQNNIPKACTLISPWLDLTESHDSYELNKNKDVFLPKKYIKFASNMYLSDNYYNSIDQPHFLASPHFLNSDFLKYFPPTLIHVCENEMLLDDSKNFTINAPPNFTLKIFPPLPHVFHLVGEFIHESNQGINEIADFFIDQIKN